MKESERLRIEAEQTDNDLAALGKYTKILRTKRKEKFEETWLEKLQEQTEVTKRDNGSYPFSKVLPQCSHSSIFCVYFLILYMFLVILQYTTDFFNIQLESF